MPLKQKILLVFFGIFLVFFLLEAGLRLAGFILLSVQEYRNSLSLRKNDTYRIVCIGESTTQGHYPAFLQKALDRRNIGVTFSVIDKGVAGTNTGMILSQIEGYLDQYHPDIIVAMMGINDQGSHLPHEEVSISSWVLFVRDLRVYKLIRLLGLHIAAQKNKKDTGGSGDVDAASETSPDDELKGKNFGECLEIGKRYRSLGNFTRAERAYRRALELAPENDRPYVELAWFYQQQGVYADAEVLFKKALKLNPLNADAYAGIGWFYKLQGDSAGSEKLFRKALELDPENIGAYHELSIIYRYRGEYDAAIDLLERAREKRPGNKDIMNELAFVYRTKGEYAKAEEVYKQALELDLYNARLYTELGFLYREELRYKDMETLFRTALRYNPDKDWVYGALCTLYEETGQKKLAEEYARKANLLRLQRTRKDTIENYRSLKKILAERGVMLVCVQYPMRSIESVKAVFDDPVGLIFVDNEKVFKEAVAQHGRDRYFLDMFGGDFGHCSDEGDTLLAENIARVIIAEVFKIKGD